MSRIKLRLGLLPMQRQYDKLKEKVNPLMNFKYKGRENKNYKILKEQVATMKRMLKEYSVYGENMHAHTYKYNFYQTLLDMDVNTPNDVRALREIVAKKIRYMSSKKFGEFYQWAKDNFYDTEIFDFNDYYEKDEFDRTKTAINVIIKRLKDYFGEEYFDDTNYNDYI